MGTHEDQVVAQFAQAAAQAMAKPRTEQVVYSYADQQAMSMEADRLSAAAAKLKSELVKPEIVPILVPVDVEAEAVADGA